MYFYGVYECFFFVFVFLRHPLTKWITSTVNCCCIRIRSWGRRDSLEKLWSISPPTRNRSVINWPWRKPKVHQCTTFFPIFHVFPLFPVLSSAFYDILSIMQFFLFTFCLSSRLTSCLWCPMENSLISFLLFVLWMCRGASVESGTVRGGGRCIQTTAGEKSWKLVLLPWPGEIPQAWYTHANWFASIVFILHLITICMHMSNSLTKHCISGVFQWMQKRS